MDDSLGLNKICQNWGKASTLKHIVQIGNNVWKLVDELSDNWFDSPTGDNGVPADDATIDGHPITDINKLEDNSSMETLKTCAQAKSTISSLEDSSQIRGLDVFDDALNQSVICDGNGKESFATQAPANGFLASEDRQDDMSVQLMLPKCTTPNGMLVVDVPINGDPTVHIIEKSEDSLINESANCSLVELAISSLEDLSPTMSLDITLDDSSRSIVCDDDENESLATKFYHSSFLADADEANEVLSDDHQNDMNVELTQDRCTLPDGELVVDALNDGDPITDINKSEDNFNKSTVREISTCAELESTISPLEDSRDDSGQNTAIDDNRKESFATKVPANCPSEDHQINTNVKLMLTRCTSLDRALVNAPIDDSTVMNNKSEYTLYENTFEETVSSCTQVESIISSLKDLSPTASIDVARDGLSQSIACDDNEKEPFAINIPANQVLTSETHQNDMTVELMLSRCSLPNESYAIREISYSSRNEEISNSIKTIDLNAMLGDLEDVDLEDTWGDDENYELALASSMESRKNPYWVKLKASIISNLRWLKENKQLHNAYRSVYLRKQHKERSHPSSISTLSHVHDSLSSDWELL
ncbi:uncharacterized protein [Typha latifolia]|uniref:uncharacterized protein isoform X2 n=1 Tax=Typha latifolia TaxID=4733 RepID=UPI003C2DD52F